jgi:hypothetical protein
VGGWVWVIPVQQRWWTEIPQQFVVQYPSKYSSTLNLCSKIFYKGRTTKNFGEREKKKKKKKKRKEKKRKT